jgi:hypothetical protein
MNPSTYSTTLDSDKIFAIIYGNHDICSTDILFFFLYIYLTRKLIFVLAYKYMHKFNKFLVLLAQPYSEIMKSLKKHFVTRDKF